MKEIKIVVKIPDFKLIFQSVKQSLINKKLEIILLIIILSLLILWEISIDIIVFIMIGSILLPYGWKKQIIIQALKKAEEDLMKSKLSTVLLLIILTLLLIWKFNIETIVFSMIFFVFLLYSWENRILLGLGLFFLIICCILLISQKYAPAEQMGIYGYYFLMMTVLLQIVEYIRKTNSPVKNKIADY